MSRRLEALRGSLPGGEAGIVELRRGLGALERSKAVELGHALVDAWIDGSLGPAEWEGLTGEGSPDGARRAMHLVWDALVEDGFAPSQVERLADGSAIQRWAWSPRWVLMSQDEDLLAFGMPRELLEIAADPACPKRDYLVSIAAHDVRDQAHAFVTRGDRRAPNESPLALAGELAPLARKIGALEVASYFERLASFERRERVDREGAIQRALDLSRCTPPARDALDVRVDGDGWRVTYRVRAMPDQGFVIARKTGAMRPS